MDTTLEPVREEPIVDTKVESLQVKKKPKQLVKKDKTPSKIDLSKKENNAISKSESERDVLSPIETSVEKGEETNVGLQEVGSTHAEPKESSEKKEEKEVEVTIVNATNEQINKDSVEKNLKSQQSNSTDLPENIEKLVEFMKDTGGNIEDYMRLNADYSTLEDTALLKEYYKSNKPYLSHEEINLQLEDKFAFDEDYDDEKNSS